ncbi:glutaminase kidney isoform, mitochondrial-like isoform X2 [Poeciliopsis prolifica]|uniref:glutaminase kidney isoform, mitochondrial-like isoform X2 n=1 Tax=Poeciliopsis prolifica TaxID=188132 RepID=UPI002413E6E6|nr:glutaminase kidney isoform, mitochondrial-like isoform X2 [Poeciliopsis prolifica]
MRTPAGREETRGGSAAAEGHAEVVRFLLEACKVNPVPKDRWGNTPMDEAVHFGHHDVVTILRDYHTQYSPQDAAPPPPTRRAPRRTWTACCDFLEAPSV